MRVTKRDGKTTWLAQGRPRGFLCPGKFCPNVNECEKARDRTCPYHLLLDKLADFEDAEEQGLLIRLPCKVGDTVYYLNPFDEIENGKITMIQQKADGTWKFRVTTDFSRDVTTDAIGKTLFLSREEAEAVLKDGDGE